MERLDGEFGQRLPWVTSTLARYEAQTLPEARFVRGLDKCLPKIVHLLDGCAGLREQGMDPDELRAVFVRQEADMRRYVGEFTELMDLPRCSWTRSWSCMRRLPACRAAVTRGAGDG